MSDKAAVGTRQLGPATTGLRNVAVMLAASVAMALIVGRALSLAPSDLARLVNATLLTCGLATLVQAYGIGGIFGARLPAMLGPAFAALGPLLVIAGDAGLGTAPERLQVMAGATIVAGALMFALATMADRVATLFPPVVRGAVMLMIGIVLLRSAVGWMAAPPPEGLVDLGPPGRLGLALAVLVVIVVLMRFGPGWLAGVAVLAGIALGVATAAGLGAANLGRVGTAPWLGFPGLFGAGRPRFEVVPVLSMCIVMLAAMIEAAAMLRAVAASVRGPTPRRPALSIDSDSTRGTLVDGLGCLLGGLLGALPVTSMAMVSGPDGLRSGSDRLACLAGGVILVLLGLSPKLGVLAGSVPQVVLGGAGLVMFGTVAASGIRILADVDYERQRQNLFVVALSLGFGLVPLVAPLFFKVVLARNPALAPLLQSSVVLTAVSAVLLDQFFNGATGRLPASVSSVSSEAATDGSGVRSG